MASRLARVRQMMRVRNLDALVAYSDMARSGDIAYLTNFHPFDARMPGVALVTPEHLDAIYKVTGRDLIYVNKYVWVEAQSVDFLSGSLADKLAEVTAGRGLKGKAIRVGLTGGTFAPTAFVQGMSDMFAGGEVIAADPLMVGLRRDKSTAERTIIRLAAAKCEAVLSELASAATSGMSETQLAAHADYLCRKAGAQDAEVLFYTAAGANGVWARGHFPFRPAAERPLPNHGSIGVYIALQYHGYWVELSQSLFVGAPRPAQVEAHQLALAAFDEFMSGGVESDSQESDAAATWVHGIGLDRSEAPLPTHTDQTLREGDVVAAHVAVKRGGDVTYFGRPVLVSRPSASLVPPNRTLLASK